MPLRRLLLLVQLPFWALLLISFALLLSSLNARVRATTLATDTRVQVEGLNTLLVNALDMETGVRGYVIAGQSVFLEPYRRGAAALPATFAALRAVPDRLTAADAETLSQVEALLTRWQLEVAEPEITLRQSSAQGAAAIVQSQKGKKLLDQVRADLARVATAKTTLLAQREARAAEKLRHLYRLLGALGGVLLLLSVLSTVLGARLLIRPLEAVERAARRLSHDGDATPIPQRGPLEFRTLAGTFNGMSERVRATQDSADRTAQHLHDQNGWMRALSELSDALQAARSVEEGGRILGRALPTLLPGTSGTLQHHNASRNLLLPVVTWGGGAAGTQSPDHCWALRRGEVQTPEGHVFSPGCVGVTGAYLCVPLFSHGETLGLLRVQAAGSLSPDTRAAVTDVARQVSLAFASLRLQDRLLQQSIRDPLTGLFNRRRLEEALAENVPGLSSGRPVSLVALDIDHFKRLNDTFGHDAGDAALVRVSAALRDLAPTGSVPARPGGEEFSLLLPEHTLEQASALAEQVRAAVESLALSHAGIALGQITVSLGVATADGSVTADALVSAADQALYAAKRQGRNRVVVSGSPAMHSAVLS